MNFVMIYCFCIRFLFSLHNLSSMQAWSMWQIIWWTNLTCFKCIQTQSLILKRHFAQLLCNAQSSRRDTLWLFSFKFPAHFDTKFVTPGGTVLKLRNFLYMHVGPKMAPKCDFVYKINANWVFSHSSYKYAYFYSQWLKWICFSIIVL